MQYMLLIHGSEDGWEALSDAERSTQYERYGKLQSEMQEHGHYVGGDELDSAASARLIRVRDRETIVSDGPFIETKEQLGGYFVVECDLDTAVAYAAAIPAAEGGTIEVRPIVEGPDG